MAGERSACASQLQARVTALGGDPEEHSSYAAAAHRGCAAPAQCIAAAGVIALARSLGISNLDRDIRSNIVSYVAATPASEGLFAQHPLLQRELFKIDAILPAITYLAHEACKLTGDAISAGAGRYARMFTSITLGGFDPDIGDDAFESLLPKVMDARSTFAPRTAVDELITIAV